MKKIISFLMTLAILSMTVAGMAIPTFAASSQTLISESTPVFDPNEWLIADAYYDETNEYFVLTDDYSPWQTGSVWYNHPYDNNFTLELDYYTGSSNRALGGADGIVVAFYANYSYTMAAGEEMGFTGCGGYGVELDTYRNSNQGDPSSNHIALIKESVGNHIVTSNLPESEDEQWHHLKVIVLDGNCSVYVDNALKFTQEIEETGYGWIGITSATGNGENLHAVKNILIDGNSSTSIDGKYLDLKLSHKKISNNCTDDLVNGVYEYEITAEIKNSAEATAKNVTVTLDLEDALSLKEGLQLLSEVGDIKSNESKYVKWTVYADWPHENMSANYGVTARIDNSATLRQENYIYLMTRNEHDNTFILGVDEWNFSNSGAFYDPNSNETYYMTASDYAALMESLNNSEKQAVSNYQNSRWGGSCYGMSAVAILVKMGVIEPTIIQDGSSSLHSVSKTNNDDVESLINFYHFQQKTNATLMNQIQFALLSTEQQLSQIEAKATSISTGGSPFLLAFSGKGWGHAVVGYGIEHGTYNFGGFLGLFQDKYDSRILIYDCSNLSSPENSYLYYNSGTGEWFIPQYTDANKLIMACNDISVLDYVNYEITTNNHFARLVFEGDTTGYVLTLNGGQEVTVDADTDLRNEGLISFYDANIMADGTYGPSQLTLALPSLSENYSITPQSSAASNLTMYYENTALSVDCAAAEKIDFGATGQVSLQGVTGDYEIELLQNQSATPWTRTTIKGTDSGNISLAQVSNGVILSGNNLQNVSVTASSNNGTQTIQLPIVNNSVLLTNSSGSADTLIALIDADGDGTYESQYDGYTVTFDSNGGTGDMDPIQNVSTGSIELPQNGFGAPAGMKFKGWAETPNGDVISGTTYNVTKDTTLYAIWEEAETDTSKEPSNSTTEQKPQEPDDTTPDSESNTNGAPANYDNIKYIVIGVVIAGALIAIIIVVLKKKKR